MAPLTEAELLSVCHADPSNPSREAGLTLRRYNPPKKNLEHFFGARLPATPAPPSATTSGAATPKLSVAIPKNDNLTVNPPSANPPSAGSSSSGGNGLLEAISGPLRRHRTRASETSVLSALGIIPTTVAEEPVSPSKVSDPSTAKPSPARKGGIRGWLSQRPPSELITSYLPQYFPNTEKKVLERTARQSVYLNRDSLARASWMSGDPRPRVPGGSIYESEAPGRSSMDSSPSSRKSYRRRTATSRPTRLSTASTADSISIPRVSISTEEPSYIDPPRVEVESEELPTEPSTPHVLPPVLVSEESFSDSLLPQIGDSGRLQLMRNNSKRSSIYTEIKSKSTSSDSASMLTLDEITAEVESRRTTFMGDRKSMLGVSVTSSPQLGEDSESTYSATGDEDTLMADHGVPDKDDESEEEMEMEDEEEYDDDDEEEVETNSSVPQDVVDGGFGDESPVATTPGT